MDPDSYYTIYLHPVSFDPKQNEFIKPYLNVDSIIKGFKPFRNLRSEEFYEYLEEKFTPEQKQEFQEKLNRLKNVQLDTAKLSERVKIVSDANINSSFPVVQQGKDSMDYAFEFQTGKNWGNWGRILIHRKTTEIWNAIGEVKFPLFNLHNFKSSVSKFPTEYQVLNYYFAGRSELINDQTVATIIKEEETLNSFKKFENWEYHQKSFSNWNAERIVFRDLLSGKNLAEIVNYLTSSPEVKLDDKFLLENLEPVSLKELKKKSRLEYGYSYGVTSVSYPLIFQGKEGSIFGIFYFEKVNGPENGSGNLVLMQQVEKEWKTIFELMLWIS
ncbi:hypothetical protein HC174_09090 [Salinimicrobium sp. CDJ15-81-2]|nr:hypothetical protein [Salinimicrobium nanhaiense]